MAADVRGTVQPPYVWLVQDLETGSGGNLGWTPLRRADGEKLEEALAGQAEQSAIVPVESGRCDVDLRRRRFRPVFWDEPERKVIRSLWFKQGASGAGVPYDELDAQELEAALQRLRRGKERAPLLVPVEGGRHDVRFELAKSAEPPSEGLLSSFFSSGTGSQSANVEPQYTVVQESVDRSASTAVVSVWRGYYSGPGVSETGENDEEDLLPERVECLIFVVHGIGQYRSSQTKSTKQAHGFHQDVAKVRRQAVKRLRQRAKDGLPVPGRLEFLPLEWFESIHVDGDEGRGIGNRLKDVTLPSVPALRDFANFAVADLMVYQDDEWRERLHCEIMVKMGTLWDLYRSRTNDYSGEVAVIGHSLGSVIMFDLIQKMLPEHSSGFLTDLVSTTAASPSPPQSSTEVPQTYVHRSPDSPSAAVPKCPAPRCLFALGSPLGMFLSIRLTKRGHRAPRYFRGIDVRWPVACAGRGWRFFNIFHPDDPVAYRVEPLLNPDYARLVPRRVPCGGGVRFHHQVREWWRGFGSSTAPEASGDIEEPSSDVLLVHTTEGDSLASFIDNSPASSSHSSAMDRMDYALQESALESLNETLSAMSSHLCYWDCEDVNCFIVDQILDAILAKKREGRVDIGDDAGKL